MTKTKSVDWAEATKLKRALHRSNNELLQVLNATGYYLADSKEVVAEAKANGFKTRKVTYYVVDTNQDS